MASNCLYDVESDERATALPWSIYFVRCLLEGADAVGIGRLEVLALAAGGVPAVVRMLELLETEMQLNLASMGLNSIDQLTPASVAPAQSVGLPGVLSAFPLLAEDYGT